MAIDTTTPRSRRALLTAAIGGAAAAATATVARAVPTEAANGDTIKVGGTYSATSTTQIFIQNGPETAFIGSAGSGNGLYGASNEGTAVVGSCTSGVGVDAASTYGHGLRVSSGRIKVDDVSGVATIKKGRKSVTVDPRVPINSRTFVLLTPMANIGSRALWFTKNASADTFAIHMSWTRGGPTKVAWLALERG